MLTNEKRYIRILACFILPSAEWIFRYQFTFHRRNKLICSSQLVGKLNLPKVQILSHNLSWLVACERLLFLVLTNHCDKCFPLLRKHTVSLFSSEFLINVKKENVYYFLNEQGVH